jgi:hypothetical protein
MVRTTGRLPNNQRKSAVHDFRMSSPQLATRRRQEMVCVCGSRSINLTRIELDALIRALQFEADAMTAKASRLRGTGRSSLLALAEANRVLIAILEAEWGEP